MGTYIECDKCKTFGIEVIGDKALSCENCEQLKDFGG